MNPLLHTLPFLSAAASTALFSAIWEGTVLTVGVFLCLRLLPGLSAAARSVVWLNVFILLTLLHVVPAFAGHSPAVASSGATALRLDPRWSIGIAVLWASVSLWRGSQLVLGAIHLKRLARRARPISVDAELQALLSDAPRGRAAQLCTSEEVARPSVLGFFRPRILVPPALVNALSPQELQQVVLHEMEHLRRADDWTNLFQKIGLVLFPLNPVLLWVERRLCAERELACDDRVVRSSAGRKAYALCLTHLAEFSMLRRSFSLVLGAWERRPELVRRVHRILGSPVRSMGRRPAIFATGSVLAAALGCSILLAHSPELVSFVPVRPIDEAVVSTNPHELARALGGTPQLVKAVMPVPAANVASHPNARLVHPLRSAVLKQSPRRRPAPSRVATLAPLPVLDRRTLVVLTEWHYAVPPRVVLAVSRDPRTGPAGSAVPAGHPGADPAVVVPATFAVVPTPNGWLIIQI